MVVLLYWRKRRGVYVGRTRRSESGVSAVVFLVCGRNRRGCFLDPYGTTMLPLWYHCGTRMLLL